MNYLILSIKLQNNSKPNKNLTLSGIFVYNLYIRSCDNMLKGKKLGTEIGIDALDVKILNILIKNARTRLKDIAKQCKISDVSVLKRIKRLKTLKVITGATLLVNAAALDCPIVAFMGINFNGNQEQAIERLMNQYTNLVEISTSVGKYDLCALVYANNLTQLDEIASSIREGFGAREVALNVWSYPAKFTFENVELQQKGR